MTEQQVEAERAAILEQLFDALFTHFKIPYGKWHLLAGALAQKHVPGFSEQRAPSGRRPKWGIYSRASLAIAVDELRVARPSLSVKRACELISDKEPWNVAVASSKRKGDALRAQYMKADRRWVRVIRDARKFDAWKKANPEEAAKLEPATLGNIFRGTADRPKALESSSTRNHSK